VSSEGQRARYSQYWHLKGSNDSVDSQPPPLISPTFSVERDVDRVSKFSIAVELVDDFEIELVIAKGSSFSASGAVESWWWLDLVLQWSAVGD